MGMDDRVSYFLKKELKPTMRVFFLGLPTIIDSGRNMCRDFFDEVDWESCDISQDAENNYSVAISDLDLPHKYDLVVDNGTLQHIIDPLNTIYKLLEIANESAKILHFIPFSGYHGFGYYQFSPELFLTLQDQGLISEVEIVLYDEVNNRFYFQINLSEAREFQYSFGRKLHMYIKYSKGIAVDISQIRRGFQQQQFCAKQGRLIDVSFMVKKRFYFKRLLTLGNDIFHLVFYRVTGRPYMGNRRDKNIRVLPFEW
jgi:hypothetical protein